MKLTASATLLASLILGGCIVFSAMYSTRPNCRYERTFEEDSTKYTIPSEAMAGALSAPAGWGAFMNPYTETVLNRDGLFGCK